MPNYIQSKLAKCADNHKAGDKPKMPERDRDRQKHDFPLMPSKRRGVARRDADEDHEYR